MADKSQQTTISEDMFFRGEIQFEDNLVIEGQMEGVIKSHGKIYLFPQAQVKADLYVHQVFVEGRLQGNIHGAEFVSLRKTGQILGDIETKELEVERGARHTGRTLMK